VSAGTSRGTVPAQSRFYLGGAATLRGYSGGAASGDAFWLGRAELGNAFPAARLVGFVDLGWAGSRANFGGGGTLAGVGIGGSFLDGLVRVDVAHGLKEPGGTRVEIYFDGML
jgi:translocation and assembly module TamA